MPLARIARACAANIRELAAALGTQPSVEPLFDRPVFHETALRMPLPADQLLRALAAQDVVGGVALEPDYPELGNAMLVCATEQRSTAEIAAYAEHLRHIDVDGEGSRAEVDQTPVDLERKRDQRGLLGRDRHLRWIGRDELSLDRSEWPAVCAVLHEPCSVAGTPACAACAAVASRSTAASRAAGARGAPGAARAVAQSHLIVAAFKRH